MARVIAGKAELASALGYSTAYFFRLVNHNVTVVTKLMEAGYVVKQKVLTPKQIEIICEYYGWPEQFAERI